MTGEDNPRVFVPPPLIFASLLVAGLLIHSETGAFGVTQLAAIGIGLAGLTLIALALGLFRRSKTRPEPWQPASTLVSSGIYRFTRNPMYLGMATLSFAVAMFFASLSAAVFTLIAVVIIDRGVISREEEYLVRRFGDDFAAYRKGVRRWL